MCRWWECWSTRVQAEILSWFIIVGCSLVWCGALFGYRTCRACDGACAFCEVPGHVCFATQFSYLAYVSSSSTVEFEVPIEGFLWSLCVVSFVVLCWVVLLGDVTVYLPLFMDFWGAWCNLL